ncbi:MAG: recombinase family protein [Bdellovibrionota bacterium]
MVVDSADFTKNWPSNEFTIESAICTTPLYSNSEFLKQKYEAEKLSARQIAILIGSSHSTINDALIRFGIMKSMRVSGHVPYGFKLVNGQRVRHVREQKTIQRIVGKKRRGWSNARIAEWLNKRKIPTPQGARQWYPATVGRIAKTVMD